MCFLGGKISGDEKENGFIKRRKLEPFGLNFNKVIPVELSQEAVEMIMQLNCCVNFMRDIS